MLARKLRMVAGGVTSDTQTVTTGGDGTAPMQDRRRGFISGSFGSINDGTSNIYGGAAITELYWDENGGPFPIYSLTITGATNSGWTTLTIGSTVLSRASATSFSSGSWSWLTSDTVSTQAFGAISDVKSAVFA